MVTPLRRDSPFQGTGAARAAVAVAIAAASFKPSRSTALSLRAQLRVRGGRESTSVHRLHARSVPVNTCAVRLESSPREQPTGRGERGCTEYAVEEVWKEKG